VLRLYYTCTVYTVHTHTALGTDSKVNQCNQTATAVQLLSYLDQYILVFLAYSLHPVWQYVSIKLLKMNCGPHDENEF